MIDQILISWTVFDSLLGDYNKTVMQIEFNYLISLRTFIFPADCRLYSSVRFRFKLINIVVMKIGSQLCLSQREQVVSSRRKCPITR